MSCRVVAILTVMAFAVTLAADILLQEEEEVPPPTEETPTAEALAERTGCLKCHSVDEKVIGPAYQDIAARYTNDPAAREALIETIKNGGKGNWTKISRGVPMPPHSERLTPAEIERLVDWVLGLRSEKADRILEFDPN